MAVLQFGFGNPGAHTHLPHTFTPEKVVYTGTHDNDTLLGWWKSSATEYERQQVEAYLGGCKDKDGGRCDDGVNWAMIRAASSSVASLSVVPLQDVLGLGSDARMNVPSREQGNWRWRFAAESLRPELAMKLATLAEVSDRLPQPLPAIANEEWAA
jgi:4-alpha-glucanotransferase